MALRRTPFTSGEYYHLYNRGNSKQKIFQDLEDYRRFTTLLYTCNSQNNFKMFLIQESKNKDSYIWERGKNLVSIGAYCLMPNHFHLLISEENKEGISKFMQKLSTAYVMYYNNKYKRTGGLFEGKFRSEHLDEDRYLKYIYSYIHLNPIKLFQKDWKDHGINDQVEAIMFLDQYEFSSYPEYRGMNRKQKLILNAKTFPNYFPSPKNFTQEILDWINYDTC
ncbi:MAG: transposase [Patescibacteria group bacterium]